MSETAGKVGGFYATSGTGHLVTAESGTLSSNAHQLDHKNVMISHVYKNKQGTGTEFKSWYCTPMGTLTINDAAATGTFSTTYRWYSEEGEPWADTGAIKKYGGFFNWSLAHTCDVLETTDFNDSGHRTYIAGLDGWSATAEQYWVDANIDALRRRQEAGSNSYLIAKFYVNDSDDTKGTQSGSDTGDRYEGWCLLTGLDPSVAVDSVVSQSLSFQGTSIITYES